MPFLGKDVRRGEPPFRVLAVSRRCSARSLQPGRLPRQPAAAQWPAGLFSSKRVLADPRPPTSSSPAFSSLFTSYTTTSSPSTAVSEQLAHFLC